jgi:hypothetical protein
MARMSPIERRQVPWHLRWFFRATRKMFGKELTPARIQARVPRVVWAGILADGALSGRRKISLRYIQLAKVRTAGRVGCPF